MGHANTRPEPKFKPPYLVITSPGGAAPSSASSRAPVALPSYHPSRWGCALLCELTSSRDLVLAFDGYVDSMLPSYHPSGDPSDAVLEEEAGAPAPLVITPSPLGIPAMGIPAKVRLA